MVGTLLVQPWHFTLCITIPCSLSSFLECWSLLISSAVIGALLLMARRACRTT